MELDAFFRWNSIATRVNMSSVKIIRADISCLDHSGPMFNPPKPSDLDPYFPSILTYLYIYNLYIYIYVISIYLPCFPEDISAFSRSMDLRNQPRQVHRIYVEQIGAATRPQALPAKDQ